MIIIYSHALFLVLCGKENINGYPTIKLYQFGNFAMDYEKSRTGGEFVSFLDNVPTSTTSTSPGKEEL